MFAVAATVGTMFAWDYERVQIGDLYYNLDATNQTAEVTSQNSSYPYYWSTTITTAIIPASVTYNSVTYSVTSIGSSAFRDCTRLTSVTIPNSVTSIGYDAFFYCSGLTTVTIPNSVTSIGWQAFYDCSGLTSVTIGNSVTSIGERAFYDCSGLTSVNITDIAAWCKITFSDIYCNPLNYAKHLYVNNVEVTNLVIPNSVTSIGDRAFYGCTGLTSVTIPNSVTSIGGYAFYYCDGLTSVTCFATRPPQLGYGVFGNIFNSCVLYVPAGSISAYKSAYEWKYFSNILPIGAQPADVTTTTVTPSETTADIAWPQVKGTATYTIEIKKNGELICTLTFNAKGQLISIAFAAPSRNNAPQQAQAAGFAFTVTSLDSGTTYSYTMTAKDSSGNVLKTESGTFTTTGVATAIDNIDSSSLQGGDRGRLIYHNGQIFILRGDKTYTLQGQEVK